MTSRKEKTKQKNDEEEQLALIVATAQKHPNSRVCKLVGEVQNACTRANIAALLTELAEHSEFAVDFNISVGYYLDKFINLINGDDNVFTEASYALIGGAKLYARRVDYVNDAAQLQALTLSQAAEESKEENQPPPPPAKKGRKRQLEATEDRSEVVLAPKKFKTCREKRFALNKNQTTSKMITQRRLVTEQYLHPAGWMLAHIIDFENGEDVDTKRNYKIFTYHLEHRYNTLVADINFRLHFKLKDFLEEEAENDTTDESEGESFDMWPQHSEAHVKKYLDLEDRALEKELRQPTQRARTPETPTCNLEKSGAADSTGLSELNDSGVGSFMLSQCGNQSNDTSLKDMSGDALSISRNDSGLGTSITDASTLSQDTSSTEVDVEPSTTLPDETHPHTEGISQLEGSKEGLNGEDEVRTSSGVEEANTPTTSATEVVSNATETSANEAGPQFEPSKQFNGEDEVQKTSSEVEEANTPNLSQTSANEAGPQQEDSNNEDEVAATSNSIEEAKNHADPNEGDEPIILSDLRIRLPSGDDGISVYFSELDERLQQRIASPTVVALDVLPNVPNKENLVIRVDSEIMSLCNLDEPETHMLPPPMLPPKPVTIHHNLLKISEKVLRRRVIFKLSADFELHMQARRMKRTSARPEPTERRKIKVLIIDDSPRDQYCMTPIGSECAGFDEDKIQQALSYDSFYAVDASAPLDHNPCLPTVSEIEECSAVTIREESLAPLPTEPSCETSGTAEAGTPAESNVADHISSDTREPAEEATNGGAEENPVTVSGREETSIADEGGEAAMTEAITRDNSLEATNEESEENPLTVSGREETTIADEANEAARATIEATTEENSLETTNVASSSQADTIPDFATNESIDDERVAEDDPDSSGLKENEAKAFDGRIKVWHDKLAPKLAKAREQHHFDVFELGSEIINKFETPKDTVSLEDIMEKKDKKHISRYLLSSLLLINQNNLQLNIKNKNEDEPTAWKDVNFKLLNTKRHTVAIEDNIGKVTNKPMLAPAVQKRLSSDTEPGVATTSSRVKRPRQASINMNLNVVKPLKAIEKQAANEDEDSGIFSMDSLLL